MTDPRATGASVGWIRAAAIAAVGVTLAIAVFVGIGLIVTDTDGSRRPQEVSVPMDEVMRERMRALTTDRGMVWRAEPPDTWIGTAPDAELTLAGAPVTDATLVVPAVTVEQAFDAVIQYNVAIATMIEAPPGLALGWVENELAQWTGGGQLDASLSEFGFDARIVSGGEPRVVTLTLHRNPGAWVFSECQGEPVPEPGGDELLVYFSCEQPPAPPRPLVRDGGGSTAPADQLRRAMELLLGGPTADELERGYSSVFGGDAEELLAEVEWQPDGLAIIDFSAELQSRGALNSSHNMALLFGALDRTVFQFDAVTAVEYRLEGSCEAFAEYFQGSCGHTVKSGGQSTLAGCPVLAPVELPSGAPTTAARDNTQSPGQQVSWGSGTDTVTQRIDIQEAAFEMPPVDEVAEVLVRGHMGFVTIVTDWPQSIDPADPIVQIGWAEGDCLYTVWLAPGVALDEALEFAGRY